MSEPRLASATADADRLLHPMLKSDYGLDFGQIGLITLTFQLTASLLQPAIGHFTDHRPQPFSLMAGMGFTLLGLLLLSGAHSFHGLIGSAALIGLGSAVFHPESSRVARMASGGRHGLAQSLFQVGGNAGSAIGPLVAAFVVLPRGQSSVAWFGGAALLAMAILWQVGHWYRGHTRNESAVRSRFAFGVAGIGAAVLGRLADATSIEFVYRICSYLPALGLLTAFLPDLEAGKRRLAAQPAAEAEVLSIP